VRETETKTEGESALQPKVKFCIVDSQNENSHHLLTLVFFQICTTYFLLWVTKENILKHVGEVEEFLLPLTLIV